MGDPVDLKQCLLSNRQLQREKQVQQAQLIALQADHEACFSRGMTLQQQLADLERRLGETGANLARATERARDLQAALQENRAAFLQSRIDLEKTREACADAQRQGRHFQECLHQRQAELQNLKQSMAWKITGPLRYAKQALAGYGRGRK